MQTHTYYIIIHAHCILFAVFLEVIFVLENSHCLVSLRVLLSINKQIKTTAHRSLAKVTGCKFLDPGPRACIQLLQVRSHPKRKGVPPPSKCGENKDTRARPQTSEATSEVTEVVDN